MRLNTSYMLLTLVVLGLFKADTLACSCLPPPTVLDAYAKSEIVIVARLVAFDDRQLSSDDDPNDRRWSGRPPVWMVVEKVYKGDLKVGERVKVGQGDSGTCGKSFEPKQIDQSFLFYMSNPRTRSKASKDMLASVELIFDVSICSRSKGLSEAAGDLNYLDNKERFANKTRLSGTIRNFSSLAPSVANVGLTITGHGKTFIAETDQNGFFELWGLPPGAYKITPQLRKGWKISHSLTLPAGRQPNHTLKSVVLVDVPAKKHAEAYFYVDIDNEISGKVVSPSGTLMKNVCVSAYWLTPTESSFRIPDDCTDENGKFKISELPPGKYRLEINSRGNITAEQPFETFYFPGVPLPEQARVFTVKPGDYIKDLIIRVPQTLPLIRIRGRLTFADGQPFPEEGVRFDPLDDDRFEHAEVETDKDGNFSMMIPKGAAGKLSAATNIYEIRFENCAKVKKMRKTRSGSSPEVRSNIIKIESKTSQDNIKLTFRLPPLSCN